MKKMFLFIVLGLVFLGLVVCIGSLLMNTVSAYTETPQEAIDDWYGNKFERSAVAATSQTLNLAQTVFGETARCQDDFVADNILFYFHARTGTWTAKNIRFGIMGLTATGIADMTWKGATNNGFGWVNPVAGWNNVTLNEQVSLTSNNMYFYGVHDNGSKISSTVTLTIVRWGAPQDYVMGKPPLGRMEEYDGGVWRIGATTWIRFEAGIPYLVYNRTNNVYMGQPYTAGVEANIYMYLSLGTNFTWNDDNTSVDKIAVMLRRSATAFIPNASVNYELRSSMYGGSVLAGGVLAYPYDSATSTGARWNYALLNKTVSMVNGTTYFIKLWSKAGSSYYWRALMPAVLATATYTMGRSFQGTDAYTVSSADNGTSWSMYAFNRHTDLQFKFHKVPVPSITIVDNTVNVSGSSEYSWNGSGFTVWNNMSSSISLVPNIVNSVGSLVAVWNGTSYVVYANYTGVSPNINLMIHNPNPGKGTTSYDTNFINQNASLASSVEVICRNLTTPPATLPGDYSMTIIGSEPANTPVVWNTSTTGVYADVHDDTTGQITPGNPYVGQYLLGGEYTILRSFLVFNTSSIPYGAVVNSGYIQLYVYDEVGVVDDFNVTVQQCRKPCPHFPTLLSTDFWNHGFTGDMGHENTTGYVDDEVFNISLNAGGVADILGGDWKSTDSVRWALVSDQDDASDAPVNDEYIIFYGYGVDTSKHPRLIINYTVPSSNWAYFVNLTASSNSSGAWVDYSTLYANSNGTWTFPPNGNWSGADTKYYWNVSYTTPSEGTSETGVFNFTTGSVNLFVGTNFSLINPNPANSTNNGYNFIHNNSNGINTSIDLRYNGSLDDVTVKQGEHSMVHNNFAPGGRVAQTFTIGTNGTNESQILQNITMRLYRTGFPGLVYINITNVTATGKPGTKVLSSTTFDGDSVPPLEADAKLYNISMPLAVLSPGTMYSLEATKMGVGTFEWMGFGYGGSLYAGGMPYAYLFGSWLGQPTSEMFFSVNYIAGDWSNVVNLTWSSNSSGVWAQYDYYYVLHNGTYYSLNTNMTGSNVSYWWRVVAETLGVDEGDVMSMFETLYDAIVDDTSIIVGGGGSGVLMMVPLSCVALMGGLLGVRKRRKTK